MLTKCSSRKYVSLLRLLYEDLQKEDLLCALQNNLNNGAGIMVNAFKLKCVFLGPNNTCAVSGTVIGTLIQSPPSHMSPGTQEKAPKQSFCQGLVGL